MIPDGWSAPDAAGISIRPLDVGAVSTLRGRRLRRAFPPAPAGLDAWPADWRALLGEWLCRGVAQRRWDSLLKQAGNARYSQAETLRDALLAGGWIETEERFTGGQWRTVALTFLDPGAARAALGLPDPEARRAQWAAARAATRLPDELAELAARLDGLPAQRALARLELLAALNRWRSEGRTGTWRDFAQLARGGTKAITEAEKNWLAEGLDLEAWGVSSHTPLLFLAAPLSLHSADWHLDLAGLPDFIGLTPATIDALDSLEGEIGAWRLVENRTSFERVAARHGHQDGVIWLPGFAPSWWKTCLTRLIDLRPAQGLIACDPDPAGIAIALDAARLFSTAGVSWKPWRMGAEDLAALPRRLPLTDDDRQRIDALFTAQLPESLRRLLRWMLDHGEKGEQEALL